MNNIQREQYSRQLLLTEIGEQGQQHLLNAKVFVIGAGGLGCAVLPYLVAAGIGTVGIADYDVIALHNLHRQVLYGMDDIGKPKASVAANKLKQINPNANIQSYEISIGTNNAIELIAQYDVIVDCTDNFTARYLINDACYLLHKPLVFAAIHKFEGQVAIFNAGLDAVNYRDIFPDPPANGAVLNCADAGVLGTLAGIIGCMQANETIKFIVGLREVLVNKMLVYDALQNNILEISLSKNEDALNYLPEDIPAFKTRNYAWLCNEQVAINEIEQDVFLNRKDETDLLIIDVREPGEQPIIATFSHISIPLKLLENYISDFTASTLILVCNTGTRSKAAAQILSGIFGSAKQILSLKNGLQQIDLV
jgi:adenylyltransferase/sulfurtransferase